MGQAMMRTGFPGVRVTRRRSGAIDGHIRLDVRSIRTVWGPTPPFGSRDVCKRDEGRKKIPVCETKLPSGRLNGPSQALEEGPDANPRPLKVTKMRHLR